MAAVPLWVYKNNALNLPHQVAWGDWAEVFDQHGPIPWGGSETMRSTSSLHILWEEMAPGDLVLAYQTDQQAAVGLCVVEDLIDYADERDGPQREIVLRPIERFPQPVRIHQLKHADPVLANAAALRPGWPQTLYPTTPEEAAALLAACQATYRPPEGGPPPRRRPTRGGGFGDPKPTSGWSAPPSASSGTPTSVAAGAWSRSSATTSAMTCTSPEQTLKST